MLHGNSGVGSESGSVNGNSNDNANTVNAATCNNTSNVQQEDEEINADTEDDNDAVDSCICGSGRPHRPCSTCGQCSQCNCQCHTHFTVRFRVLSESAEAAVCEKVRHIAEEAISSPESLVTWPGFDRIGKLRDRVDMVLDNSRGSLLKSIEAEVAAVVQGAAPRKK
uniref:Uncharacterized protein n=1 Tax=Craspedostauros australis TaxID=1486917 RepID=A0A7R9WL78_9STRA|mmetsp:Transcript_10325/g.28410  ORF Transcript_10325/g.28410 Transcript_10325/m.28410 type:complete len:167 (+) Transcript_10325:131-631(+)